MVAPVEGQPSKNSRHNLLRSRQPRVVVLFLNKIIQNKNNNMRQFEDFWNNDKRKKRSYFLTATVILVSVITVLVGAKVGYTKYQASILKSQRNYTILDGNNGEVKGANTTNNTGSPTSKGSVTNTTSTGVGTTAKGFAPQLPSNGQPTNSSVSYPSMDNPSYTTDPSSPIYQVPIPDSNQDNQKKIAECIAQNQKRHDVLDPVKEQIYDLQNYYAQIPDIMAEKVKGTFTNQAQLDRMIQAEQQKTQSEINQLQLQYDQLSSQYPSCSY
ncbi:MAG: hypothetical protein PHE56_13970 [Bacteroidales bacterium]|nr:hypothetical protein [Bacteroidales bacterium]